MTQPTIHVTNWSSRKLHGPGRKWTIMAKPRAWERGEGVIRNLCPASADLDAMRAGAIDLATYRQRFEDRVFAARGPFCLRAGELSALKYDCPAIGSGWVVGDGDTLCCACSREQAARGECHRVWAAELLRAAGWRVILDGRELP